LSVHILRYYERAGLIPRVYRAANSHRRYSELDLEWIAFVANAVREATGARMTELPIKLKALARRLTRWA
jgi:DNA-binding transcriptional MerR regulator